MIDVHEKKETLRTARAQGTVIMARETLAMIKEGKIPKGDVLSTARVAGIMAIKNTSSLIPFCHPLRITGAELQFSLMDREIIIESKITGIDRTGFEMEALVGVTVAGLVIYDMCKQVDKEMKLSEIYLEEKTGGKSGHYVRRK